MPSNSVCVPVAMLLSVLSLAATGIGLALALSSNTLDKEDADDLQLEMVIGEEVLGYSEEGREIRGYEIGSGENCILLFAGVHGNEKGATDLLHKFAKKS